MASSVPPIVNSYWVTDEVLVGPAPTPGSLVALQAAGIGHIVNLMEVGETGSEYSLDGVSMSIFRTSIPDFGIPPTSVMTQVLDDIDGSLDRGTKVFVHCRAGIGRSGTVVGCWLVRHGHDPSAALAVIRQRRGMLSRPERSPETPDQRRFVLGWSADP